MKQQTNGFTGTLPPFSLTSSSSQNSRKFNNLTPGNYLVAENQAILPLGGWDLSEVACQNSAGQPVPITANLARSSATIPLLSGQVLTCSFYNEQIGQVNPNSPYLPQR